MRRKKSAKKAEIGKKVVSVQVVSDEELATVGGGFRPWGWWEIQPPTATNVSYGGSSYGGGSYGGGWGGGYFY